MKIFIKAKPGAKIEEVLKIDESHYMVSVKEPPVQGRANRAIVESLARHFQKNPDKVKIISGFTSRQKIIEIL